MTASNNANTALAKFEAAFAKSFGPDTLRRTDTISKYEVIPTGSLGLDFALGVGGYVKGRLVESWGPESVGKTTVSLLGAVQAQRAVPDRYVGFIDMEQTLDLGWAVSLGVRPSQLYHVQPDTAEDVADILKSMLDSDLFSYIVVDSIGGMVNKEEFEKDAEERSVGTTPAIVTRMVKIAAVKAREHNSVVNIINQVRANLSYGADTTTGGGFALRHATTHKLKFRRTSAKPYTIGSGDKTETVGQQIAILVEKNKVAPPKRTALVSFFNQTTEKYGPLGIDTIFEVLDLGKRVGAVKSRGGWFTLPDESRHQGEDAVKDYLRTYPSVVEEIRNQVLLSVIDDVVDDEMAEG